MKIVLVSDNHGSLKVLKDILNIHQNADYYLHCGDSEMTASMIRPFVGVRGNNDFGLDYPDYRVIEIDGHRVLVIHGHRYVFFNSIEPLIKKAQELVCDVVFFGHTHMYFDQEIDGIRFINPGSCHYNRDYSRPSYAIVDIDQQSIKATRYEV